METVTYLFGAGASAGVGNDRILPIIKELPDRLEAMIELLKLEEYQLDAETPFKNLSQMGSTKCKREVQDQLCDDLQWLANESRTTASVDTLAKKYSIKQYKEKLERLKVVLSAYFSLEQARIGYDKRYEVFLLQ